MCYTKLTKIETFFNLLCFLALSMKLWVVLSSSSESKLRATPTQQPRMWSGCITPLEQGPSYRAHVAATVTGPSAAHALPMKGLHQCACTLERA